MYPLNSQQAETSAHTTVPTTAGPWSTAAVATQALAFQKETSFDKNTVGAAQGSKSIKGMLEFARVNRNTGQIKSP